MSITLAQKDALSALLFISSNFWQDPGSGLCLRVSDFFPKNIERKFAAEKAVQECAKNWPHYQNSDEYIIPSTDAELRDSSCYSMVAHYFFTKDADKRKEAFHTAPETIKAFIRLRINLLLFCISELLALQEV